MDAEGKHEVGKAQQSRDQTKSPVSRWLFMRRPPAFLERCLNRLKGLLGHMLRKGKSLLTSVVVQVIMPSPWLRSLVPKEK